MPGNMHTSILVASPSPAHQHVPLLHGGRQSEDRCARNIARLRASSRTATARSWSPACLARMITPCPRMAAVSDIMLGWCQGVRVLPVSQPSLVVLQLSVAIRGITPSPSSVRDEMLR